MSKTPTTGVKRTVVYPCGWDPTKARTAKYLAPVAAGGAAKNILKLALLVPFLGYFFGQAKK